jgi:hypothetical protein
VYPGSFDPVTVAHLHVAETALRQCGLVRVDLSISVDALGKDAATLTAVDDRIAELARLADRRPWLGLRSTPARLLVDVAAGYDVVVVGADKWHQLLDPAWYTSVQARDEALARLPVVAVAPRPPWPLPDPRAKLVEMVEVVVLDTDPAHHGVSATAVRQGRHDWRARP